MALSHRTEGAGQGILQPVQRQDRSSGSGTIQGHGIIPDDRPSRNGPLHRAFLTTGPRPASPVRNVRICPGGNHRRIHSCRHRQGSGNSRNSEKGERTVSEKLAVKFEGGPRLCHECVTGSRQGIRHDRGKCGKTAHPGRHIRQGRGHIPTSHKKKRNNETVSSGILNMYDRSKEQYPDAMALIRVGDEYKAYNQDAERLHEVLGVCARKAVSEKDGTPVMTASFRHVDLDTHLRSIIKAGSKVAINHYEKAAAPDKSMTPPLLFKGGRREIEITSEGAVIRTNGNQYDATGILKGLEKAGIDVRNISGSQWESMLRGRGTVLNPAKQKMLFSIRKQPSGYGVRIADISGKISSSVQREL